MDVCFLSRSALVSMREASEVEVSSCVSHKPERETARAHPRVCVCVCSVMLNVISGLNAVESSEVRARLTDTR